MDSDKDYDFRINLPDLEEVPMITSAECSSILGYNNTDTITLGNHTVGGGVTLTSPYTFTGSGAFNAGFCNTTYGTSSAGTHSPWTVQSTASTKINLTGEDADVEINGWSLVDAVKRIEERLGLFQLNPELEEEWADLQELGEQYRKLEQHIKDKQATWDKLKAMPPPVID
jgi:hypothetical protein